ncbi:tRNA-dependent cyclodipeptide synthase [Nocardia sp. NBC_01327]|uniref:tRNA-dependent cyclodipeptide synthase n=1 Tax=Nocardia sp. NBC_01327 TaxID=2903593 RepID=UPI002E11A50B|nr:tRNA-dependent cyclodipeptide synthase [Nocardia sp. NBC_01327]
MEPLTHSCNVVWESRHHVVFGVSPGNSYFNVDRLRVIFGWLRSEFRQIDVVIPDESLRHTFQALGYEPEKAAKKARAETNVLRNRVVRAWDEIGGPRSMDGIHRMSELSSDPVYASTLEHCARQVGSDPVLRAACEETTRDVLASKGADGDFSAAQIVEAMKYLIAELPFFVSSRRMFDVDASLNFYHQPLPLADVIFSGEHSLRAESGQGYATIRSMDVLTEQRLNF